MAHQKGTPTVFDRFSRRFMSYRTTPFVRRRTGARVTEASMNTTTPAPGLIEPLEARLLLSGAPALLGPVFAPPANWDPASSVFALDPSHDVHGAHLTPSDARRVTDSPSVATVLQADPESDRVALLNTPSSGNILASAPGSPSSGQTPFGSTFRDTSEFMLGDVWVTVVLLESNGQIDTSTEDWTTTEKNNVRDEINEGLDWWEETFERQGAEGHLSFTADFTFLDNPVETRYEPIRRSSSDESLWVNDFLTAVGYNTVASTFTDMDNWNHDQRVAHETDWAFTVFVADSSADTDGMFTNGAFAYAYLGGPFVQMTYDNDGWGISRMGQVFAHEMGHIFYALDEYPGSTSLTERSGYYNTQNLNASDGNPNPSSRVASLMAEASLQSTAYANHTSSPTSFQMIGWKDSDGDGVYDVVDVPLTLTGGGSFNTDTNTYRFSGSSSVGVLNNLNPFGGGRDITINTVDHVQYRIDGGAWTTGNAYGQASTSVAQDVVVITSGTHTIEFRTIADDTGVVSNLISDSFTVAGLPPGVTVTPTSGLTTTEAGGSATFSVVLDSIPTANVVISLHPSDATEGAISPTSLTFSPSDWNTPKTITVTGVDDVIHDGDTGFLVVLNPATSADSRYNNLNPPDVAVTNTDNDSPPPAGALVIDFSTTTLESYGGPSQDVSSSVVVLDGGATIQITGNAWKAIPLNKHNISPDAVLEFDFKSTSQGEIHGIGVEFDLLLSSNRIFSLYGTQEWGITDFNDYAPEAGGWKHYEIPIGQFYTIIGNYLILANDHDVASPTGQSLFSNVWLRERSAVATVATVEFSAAALVSYAQQDISGSATVLDDGATLRLNGNTWKALPLNYTVTPDTVLEFDFHSSSQGEIHGIGLESDLHLSSNRIFSLYGTQEWGISDFKDYSTTAPGVKHYVIPIGQYYQITATHLILANDQDVQQPTAESFFSNIRLFELPGV